MGEWLNTAPIGSRKPNPVNISYRPGGMSDDDDDYYSDDSFDYGDDHPPAPNVAVQPPPVPQFFLHPLRNAVVVGSQSDVEKCLEALPRFDINENLDGQWSALMYACSAARPEIVSLLIEKGASVHSNRPLIAVACATTSTTDSMITCAQILIDYGVDLNATDMDHLRATALHFTVKENNSQFLKFLLQKGAQVDALDVDKQTPLDWAASRGYGPIIKTLLKYNPNIDNINRDGLTPIDSAAIHEFPKTAKTLYVYNKATNRDQVDLTALDENEQNDNDAERNMERNYVDPILSHLKLHEHQGSFNKHKIDIFKLMLLTHEQIKEIGVPQLGDRMKLLDGIRKIHNLDWKSTSLFSYSVNSTISLPEATNLFENMRFQLGLMDTTIKYLGQRSLVSDENSSLFNPGMDKKEAIRIADYCKKLVSELKILRHTQSVFLQFIQKIQDNVEYRLADCISSS